MRYCFSTRLWHARGLVVWGEVKGLELVIVGWGWGKLRGDGIGWVCKLLYVDGYLCQR